MVRLTKIYTRTGDKGTTRLGDMSVASKHDPRVEAYGTVDEANASIGLAIAALEDGALKDTLLRIQNELFDLGADLCVPDRGQKLEWEPLRVTPQQATRLEADIDAFNAKLSPLESFILPGGSQAAARLHLARTIARRAERRAVELKDLGEPVSEAVIIYLNRLSDFLFVAARVANDEGRADVLWVPGKTR
ncbi:cob(I)yrinic acid a,c-diamide adenosyltransferase [Glycocaulis abyssi]|uniref:Corrinoid adenosyltransferase n=1 Tax=Glycocaulis abyssi TaxID=1433403 RepID=A0ABV9NCA7_9PROT